MESTVCKAMGFSPCRGKRRQLLKRERAALYVTRPPDAVCSRGFIADELVCDRRFRTLKVVDAPDRVLLHIEVDTSTTSDSLVGIVAHLQRAHGLLEVLRTDTGPALLGARFEQWGTANGIGIRTFRREGPTQNADIARFSRTFR